METLESCTSPITKWMTTNINNPLVFIAFCSL